MITPTELADRADRDTARFVFDTNIIVEAGAGTGKTTLLIDRLSFWLLTADSAEAGGIVALTFTEKAAAEIKNRLTAHLQRAAVLFSGPAEELLKDRFCAELVTRFGVDTQAARERVAARAIAVLNGLERAQIGTIHSFASHILRLFPVEAGVDPQAEIDAGDAASAFFAGLWNSWLDTELGEAAPRRERWKKILADVSVDELETFARALVRPDMRGYKMNTRFAEFATICREKAAAARALAVKYAPKKPRKLETALADCAQELQAFAHAFETVRFEDATPVELGAPGQPTDWTDEDYAAAKALVNFVKTADMASQKVVCDCVELLDPFAELYHEKYRYERLLSFDELLVRARDLLKNNIAARNRLKREYRAILIDEFQDTDPLQGEMLLYLAEDDSSASPDWRELKLKPGKLFVVGDPKQSIYRFRGADMKAYDMFIGLMLAQGARRCLLKTNFRSTRALIGSVNHFTAPVMRREQNVQPDYVPINPPPNAHCGAVPEVVLVTGEGETPVRAADSRDCQAELISGWIKNNAGRLELENGKILRLKDIAVLFRSASSLGVLLDAFKRHCIGYVVEEKRFFYATPEVTDLLNLLAVLDNPRDTVALSGLLRSPLAGLNDRELYELRCAGELDYAAPAPLEKAELFFANLRRWRVMAGEMPSRLFIETVLRQSRAAELLAIAYGGEQTALNVFKFGEIFARAGELEGLNIGAFVRRAADYIAEKTGEGESPLADEMLDAVNIMTMHKAKGLEFPVVIIPNISGASSGAGDKPACIFDATTGLAGLRVGGYADFAMALLEEQEKRHSAAEEARVFYVALTRARNRLVLFGTDKQYSHHGKFADNSVAKLIDTADSASFSASGCGMITVQRVPLASAGEGRSAATRASELPRARDCAAWRTLNHQRIERFELFKDKRAFASPTGLDAERDFLTADDGESVGRDLAVLTGNICHKTLELHGFGGAVTADEVRRAANYFTMAYPAGLIGSAVKSAVSILSGFADTAVYRELAGSEILGREIPFIFTMPDGTVMRGVMDMVARKGGIVTVYDYKSDAVASGAEAVHAARYAAQKEAYTAIINKLFPGTRAAFRFVFLRTGAAVEL